MCQRMLDKQEKPTIVEMEAYCGKTGGLFTALNAWLADVCLTEQTVVFPYGNTYGWGVAHRKKNKLMCNVFPERGAFTVMMRLSNEQWAKVYDQTHAYMQECIDHKYPCGGGGWIHYRVAAEEQLGDVMKALAVRCF